MSKAHVIWGVSMRPAGSQSPYEKHIELINERLELAEEQLKECDCKGSVSEPWFFCDDCQEARDILDNPEQIEEEIIQDVNNELKEGI